MMEGMIMKKESFKKLFKLLNEEEEPASNPVSCRDVYRKLVRAGTDIVPYIIEELKIKTSKHLIWLLDEIVDERITGVEDLNEATKIWLGWGEENEVFMYRRKDIIFEYDNKRDSGYFNEISDSKKYVKINANWYDSDKIKILDTFNDIREDCDKEEEEGNEKSVTVIEEEKRKITITKELKGNMILYRTSVRNSGIGQGNVIAVSPEEFYIQIDNQWYPSSEIIILEVLEEGKKLSKSTFIANKD